VREVTGLMGSNSQNLSQCVGYKEGEEGLLTKSIEERKVY
jgi:hypothetical protein